MRESPDVNTHCIAHQEALVASDAFKVVWKLLILDDLKQSSYLGSKELQPAKGIEKPHGFIWFVVINHLAISLNPLVFSKQNFGKSCILHVIIFDVFQVLKPYWY